MDYPVKNTCKNCRFWFEGEHNYGMCVKRTIFSAVFTRSNYVCKDHNGKVKR